MKLAQNIKNEFLSKNLFLQRNILSNTSVIKVSENFLCSPLREISFCSKLTSFNLPINFACKSGF